MALFTFWEETETTSLSESPRTFGKYLLNSHIPVKLETFSSVASQMTNWAFLFFANATASYFLILYLRSAFSNALLLL